MRQIPLALGALALVAAVGPARAEVTETQVQALEARLAQLEAAAATADKTESLADRVRINGFMSVGMGRADIDHYGYDADTLRDEWTHAADATVGLQFTARVNDRVNAVMQLVGRGTDNYDVSTEWAYVGYRLTDQDELRFGRQRFPFFAMSEYLEVGYAYPWAKPPIEVYLSGMPSAFDGLAWKRTSEIGDWTNDLQLVWGSTDFPTSDGTFSLRDSFGAGISASRGNWTFTGTYSHGEATFDQDFFNALSSLPPPPVGPVVDALDDSLGWYAGVGLQYDDGTWLVMAEGTKIRVDGYFPDTNHAYVTVGRRFGKVMPHVTYSRVNAVDEGERAPNPLIGALCMAPYDSVFNSVCLPDLADGSFDGVPAPFPADTLARMLESEQDSVTLGVRYDFLPNAALKVDWTNVINTHGTYGFFGPDDGNLFYGDVPEERVNVYRAVVDVVF